MNFQTLDDVDVKNKTVLVRVDINSPIDPESREILDDTRIRECTPTLRELAQKSARVVVLAHQGRPGGKDFIPLEKHARLLGEILGQPVKYVKNTIGQAAQDAIKALKPGEILLLENVRFCSEEMVERSLEEQARTEIVRNLSKLADLYVNDAFAAAHRSQPSLVGFGQVLPAVAGRLMERELKNLERALTPERPCVYVLGGVKVNDSLTIIENVFGRDIADSVLTGGFVGHTFLEAAGRKIGDLNLQALIDKGYKKQIERAKGLLANHGGKIKFPIDLVIDDKGQPMGLSIYELPTELPIRDIGKQTIEEYSKKITGAKTVVANGPLGMFEKPEFAKGTFEVLRAMANSKAFTIIGGGHMVAAAKSAGISDRIKHLSTGGGACISFLSGERLPVVEMLVRAKGG